jgi:uncharacterized membrane protein
VSRRSGSLLYALALMIMMMVVVVGVVRVNTLSMGEADNHMNHGKSCRTNILSSTVYPRPSR